MSDEVQGGDDGEHGSPDSGGLLGRLERKYAAYPAESADDQLDEDDWDDEEERYDGDLDAGAVALLGQEDAVKDAGMVRERSGQHRRGYALVNLWTYYDESPASAFGARVAQAHEEGWGEALWSPYSRAYDAHQAAMDIALRAESHIEAEGMTAVNAVDLRYWEPNPKAKHTTEREDRWRPGSRWKRFLRQL